MGSGQVGTGGGLAGGATCDEMGSEAFRVCGLASGLGDTVVARSFVVGFSVVDEDLERRVGATILALRVGTG
jgi:hypothetical protein